MEKEKDNNYYEIGFRLSNFWVNFLFYFTITTIGISLYIFFGGEDKQFIPVRILSAMLWAKFFPIIKK